MCFTPLFLYSKTQEDYQHLSNTVKNNLKISFSKKSNNFPLKISQVTSFFGKEVDSGLCALNFYMESPNFKKNLYSLEWIYYLKSKLTFLNGNHDESIRLIKLSLDLNPEFELSKTFLKKNF